MASAGWHHPSRKIAPVHWGDSGRDALTCSFPVDGGLPNTPFLSPEVPSAPTCPPSCGIPPCRGCRSGPTPHGPPQCLSLPIYLCLRQQPSAAHASQVPLHAWSAGEASQGLFPCQHPVTHWGQQGTARSPLQHPARGNAQTQQGLLAVRGQRAPDPACNSGAVPAQIAVRKTVRPKVSHTASYQSQLSSPP